MAAASVVAARVNVVIRRVCGRADSSAVRRLDKGREDDGVKMTESRVPGAGDRRDVGRSMLAFHRREKEEDRSSETKDRNRDGEYVDRWEESLSSGLEQVEYTLRGRVGIKFSNG